jgi:peroxiredoxin
MRRRDLDDELREVSQVIAPRLAFGLLFLCAASSLAFSKDVLKPGDIPPDELGKSIEGETVRVSDHAGKIVIISFWAAWCEPCRQETPVLNSIQRTAGSQNLRVFSINIEPRAKFHSAKFGFRKSPVTLISDANENVSPLYGAEGIPHMVIVGRDGKIASIIGDIRRMRCRSSLKRSMRCG